MKQKTYFSTIAFLIFFPPTEFFKNWYIYASNWSHQKFEKNSPTRSGDISARSWKIWKSHGPLDPTLRMREVVHARSIKFPRVRNNRLPSGRIVCEKGIFFLSIVSPATRKVTKTDVGEFCRSHLLYRATRSIFSSLLSLILIHLADAYILVMACVDCARACS